MATREYNGMARLGGLVEEAMKQNMEQRSPAHAFYLYEFSYISPSCLPGSDRERGLVARHLQGRHSAHSRRRGR